MDLIEQYLQNYYEIISIRKTLVSFLPGSIRIFDRNSQPVYQYTSQLHGIRHRRNLSHEQYLQINDAINRRTQLEIRLKQLENHSLVLEQQLHSEKLNPITIILNDQASKYQQQCIQEQQTFERMVAIHENPSSSLLLTNSGIYVKSKSEALIINQLLINNIQHIYEKPLQLKNRVVHPDATLILPDRIKYWEHVGLTNNPSYMDKWWKKYKEYIDSGFLIDRDLIVTYEFDGFSSKYIQKVIDLHVLS